MDTIFHIIDIAPLIIVIQSFMNQIQSKYVTQILWTSSVVKWLCVGALIVFAASTVFDGLSLHLSSDESPIFRTGTQTTSSTLPVRLAALPYQLSICALLIAAIVTFDQYARGNIFTHRSVAWFRWFAVFAVAAAGFNALQGVFVPLFSWFLTPQSEIVINVTIGGPDIMAFGAALILFAIASIQKEAQRKFDEFRLIF